MGTRRFAQTPRTSGSRRIVVAATVVAGSLAGSVVGVAAAGPDPAEMLRLNSEHTLRENGRLDRFEADDLLLLNQQHVMLENRPQAGFGPSDLLRLNNEHVVRENEHEES